YPGRRTGFFLSGRFPFTTQVGASVGNAFRSIERAFTRDFRSDRRATAVMRRTDPTFGQNEPRAASPVPSLSSKLDFFADQSQSRRTSLPRRQGRRVLDQQGQIGLTTGHARTEFHTAKTGKAAFPRKAENRSTKGHPVGAR